MIKVLFICHGNICRSPLAESYFTHLVSTRGLSDLFEIASAATSQEEIGNPPHPGTQRILAVHGIPLVPHHAVQLTKADGENYDYLIGMDSWNMRNIARIVGADASAEQIRLLDLTDEFRDVADPWYTGDFAQWKDSCLSQILPFLCAARQAAWKTVLRTRATTILLYSIVV